MTLDELVVTVGAKVEHGEFQDVFALLDHLGEAFHSVLHKVEHYLDEAFKVIDETAQHAVEVDRLAQSYGMTAEEIEGLGWAAKRSGVSNEALIVGMRRLAMASQAAAAGNVNMVKALHGIEGTTAFEKLESASRVFSTMENGWKKTALAQQLFGRAGAQLIPMLNRGPEGIHELMEAFEASGAALSEQTMRAAKEYRAAKAEVDLFKEALEVRFSSKNIEPVTKLWKALGEVLKSKGAKKAVDELARAFGYLTRGLGVLAGWAAKISQYSGVVLIALGAVTAAFGTVAVAATIAAAKGAAAAASFAVEWLAAAWPIVLIGTILGLVAEDIATFMEGGESYTGDIVEWFNASVIGASDLKQTLKDLAYLVTEVMVPAVKSLSRLSLAGLKKDFEEWGATIGILPGMFERLTQVIDVVMHSVTALVTGPIKLLAASVKAIAFVSGKAGESWQTFADEQLTPHPVTYGSATETLASPVTIPSPGPIGLKDDWWPQSKQVGGGTGVTTINAPINVTAPPGADAQEWTKATGENIRQVVHEELGTVLQHTYAAHGGGR